MTIYPGCPSHPKQYFLRGDAQTICSLQTQTPAASLHTYRLRVGGQGPHTLHLTSALVDLCLQTTSKNHVPREAQRSCKGFINKEKWGQDLPWGEAGPQTGSLDGVKRPERWGEEGWRGAHHAARGHVAHGSLRESRRNHVVLRQSIQHPGTLLESDNGLIREGWSPASSIDRTTSQRTWGSSEVDPLEGTERTSMDFLPGPEAVTIIFKTPHRPVRQTIPGPLLK